MQIANVLRILSLLAKQWSKSFYLEHTLLDPEKANCLLSNSSCAMFKNTSGYSRPIKNAPDPYTNTGPA